MDREAKTPAVAPDGWRKHHYPLARVKPLPSDLSETELRKIIQAKVREVGSLLQLSYRTRCAAPAISRALHGAYIPNALSEYLGYERIEVRYNVYRKKAP